MAANPSIQLGTDGNWAIKEDNLLAYKKDETRFFNKEFDFSRSSLATFVDKDGLIKVSGVTDTELIVNGDLSDGTTNWSEVTGGDATSSTIVSGNGHPTNAIRYVSIGSSNRAYAFNDTDLYEDGKLYKFEFYYRSDVVIGSTGTSASLDWKSQVGALPINTGDAIKVNGYVTADSNDNRFAWYTSSTTSPGKFFEISGLSVVEVQTDVPRIDFKDNTTGHLLLEPQSTNLITYSEDFSKGIWSKDNVTVTNGFTSPSGDLSAYKLQPTQTSSVHLLNIAVTSSSVKTYSVFAKQNGYKRFRFNTSSSSNGYASFDLNNGSIVATGGTFYSSSSIEDYGNGWYKCSMTLLSNAPNKYNLAIEDDNGAVNFLGDGVSSIYVWGAQVEALPYATSYIPTSGSTVTRNGEVCNNSGSLQDFNSEEGVLYAEISQPQGTLGSYLAISDGNTSNRVIIGAEGGNIKSFITGSGSSISMIYSTYNANTNKVAIKYKSSSASLFYNGSLVSTTSSAPSMSGLSELKFTSGASGQNFYGKVKNIKVFKRALSDAELQKLTT